MVLYDRARVGPTTKTSDEISIVCLFWLILQANPLFCFELWYSSCFEVKCWFHTFPKRCSHTSMWILILLDHRYCHVNSFPTGVLLFKWIRSFQHPQDQLKFSQCCLFHPSPSCLCFSRPPTLFLQGLRFLNHVSFYLWEVSSFFSLNVLIRWFPMKMLNSFKFINLRCCFFSGGSNSSFRCWSYPFPHFKCYPMPVHLIIIHLSLFVSGVLKISQKNHVSILNPFELLRGFSLIQAI